MLELKLLKDTYPNNFPMNEFKNDTERIKELKTCLEECLDILNTDPRPESGRSKVRTLMRDVLSRYERGLKFTTAKTKQEGPLTFIDE